MITGASGALASSHASDCDPRVGLVVFLLVNRKVPFNGFRWTPPPSPPLLNGPKEEGVG